MAAVTGVQAAANPGTAMYALIAAQLGANANWSRPVDPTLSGATDSFNATSTTEVWKCTVGSTSFHVGFTTDSGSTLTLKIHAAEAYGAADGCAAKRWRRPTGGGAATTVTDATSVTPGAADVTSNSDIALPSANPNFGYTTLTMTVAGFPYVIKVTNKTLTVGTNFGSNVNRWFHVGAFESLVTGPADTMPLGLFINPMAGMIFGTASYAAGTHLDGQVSRNPGLGVTAETGAFFVTLAPLHAPNQAIVSTAQVVGVASQSYGAVLPRYYTKTLMSQAIIHQSRAGVGALAAHFRGYYPDLFAGILGTAGSVEPTGGGVDSVVIDGVTYYWLGGNCAGISSAACAVGQSNLIALRAD